MAYAYSHQVILFPNLLYFENILALNPFDVFQALFGESEANYLLFHSPIALSFFLLVMERHS